MAFAMKWEGVSRAINVFGKCHFQTNSDFLISMSNCLKHIACNDVLMRYFLRFSYHSVQSVKHIDCNHVLMRYFLCF